MTGHTSHRARPTESQNIGVVYYLESELGGVVKIGTTIDLDRRLATIRAKHNGVQLRVLATEDGGELQEWIRHRQFLHIRQQGEWFWHTAELAAHIRSLQP